jgi:hypothetical protein
MSARGRDQECFLVGRAAIAVIAAGVEVGVGDGVEGWVMEGNMDDRCFAAVQTCISADATVAPKMHSRRVSGLSDSGRPFRTVRLCSIVGVGGRISPDARCGFPAENS